MADIPHTKFFLCAAFCCERLLSSGIKNNDFLERLLELFFIPEDKFIFATKGYTLKEVLCGMSDKEHKP